MGEKHHDIFISYAHLDDQCPADAKHGWISTFAAQLEINLRMKCGRELSIWIDHELAKNAIVTPTLLQKIEASRTILVFMSRGYLNSPWCGKEVWDFLERNHPNRDNTESIFIVALGETNRTNWPRRLQQLTPVEMFCRKHGRTELLGFPAPMRDQTDYWSRMNELAHDISEHLESMGQGGGPMRAAQAQDGGAKANPPKVWIARPSESLVPYWERLSNAIRQAGGQVLPGSTGNYGLEDAGALRTAVRDDLMASRLLVQLLDSDPGPEMGKSDETLVALQARLARERAAEKGGPRFMQWRSPTVRPEATVDEAYRDILLGTIAEGFEPFRQLVLTEVRHLSGASANGQPLRATGPLSVCVTAGPRDRDLMDQVVDIVHELGHTPFPAATQDRSSGEFNAQFRELLENVNGVILVHGRETPMWVHCCHALVRRVIAPRLGSTWGAFVDGPPPEKESVACLGQGLLHLNCRDGISAAPIRQFVEQLQ